MSKDASSEGSQSSGSASAGELDDQDLEQVQGGTLMGGKLPTKLAEATSTSLWTREVVEDVEAY